MRYLGLIGLLALTALIVGMLPIASLQIYADEQASTGSGGSEDVVVGDGEMNLTIPAVRFEEAVNLAYTIRNITYELFQWEIGYNVTAANVTLNLGDKFLERALELKDNNTWRATVYAVVAAIHYGHAPAFANPVLARVIHENLGENDTITNVTVYAVLSASSQLKSILLKAVDYASSNNYNTTLVTNIISRGDNLTQTAQQYLDEGNTTLAFRYAVAGYRTYERAYSELVKSVFIQYLRSLDLIKPKKPWIPIGLLEKLPPEVRSEIKARIESGELKSIKDVVGEVKKEVQARIEERKEAEYSQIANIMASALERLSNNLALKGMKLRDYCYQIVKEVAQKTNATGLQLLQLSLQELQNRLGSQGLNIQGEFQGNVIKVRAGHK